MISKINRCYIIAEIGGNFTSFEEAKLLIDEAKKCEASAKETFSNNALGDTLPSVSISKKQLDEKINIVELIILSKLENSKSEARRLIKGNGVKINSQIIDDEKMIVTKKLFNNNLIKLSLGKKRHIKVKLS